MADTNEVQRYDLLGEYTDLHIGPESCGDYVLFGDYEKLRAQLATQPADAALADEWNIDDLLATAVMYMRDVGMSNEADAIIELQSRNARLRALSQPAVAPLCADGSFGPIADTYGMSVEQRFAIRGQQPPSAPSAKGEKE